MTRFISYAQNFEDVMLLRALKDVSDGCYIDIGAHHPVVDSVSKAFYDRGWRGIHVEPTSEYAALLRAQRPDEIVIQAAISDNHEALNFFEMHGLSTGDADIAQMHRSQGIESGRIVVPCLTLDDVLAQVGEREIHWLKIDVEGMEDRVLQGWQSSRLPWIVVVESTIPNSPQENWDEWEPLLTRKGYEFVYFDGLNRFYISPHQPSIRAAFRASPNVFDGFALHGDSSAPFCSYINETHRNREQALQRHTESLAADIASLQIEVANQIQAKDQVANQSEDRRHQLEAQITTLTHEVRREKDALHESTERERNLVVQLAAAREEKNQHQQALLRELLDTEQSHRQSLAQMQESKEQAAKDKDALFRELLDEKQALFDVREQRLHEMAEKISILTAAHRAREHDLYDQIRANTTEQNRLSQHWAERERALRMELSEHARANAETITSLNDELDKRTERLHLAHRLRENELLARIDSLNERKDTLLEKQADLQHRLIESCASLTDNNHLLTAKVAELQQSIQKITEDKARLHREINQFKALTAEIVQMKTSLSWRLTAPLRMLARVAKRPDLMIEGHENALTENSDLDGHAKPEDVASSPADSESALHRDQSSSVVCLQKLPQDNQSDPTPDFGPSMKTIKHIDQLLDIDDTEFVNATYRALLNRPADATGLAYYLGRLRAGYGKAKVIVQIASSKEARVIRADIPGLDALIAAEKRAGHWLKGWFQRQSAMSKQVHRIEYLLSQLERRTEARLSSIERNVEAVVDHLKHLESFGQALAPTGYASPQPAVSHSRANIVDGLTLPVAGTPTEIIAALEVQIAASREAAAFDR
ncbi:FkbM family methyltransferase [Paraburkholderia sp. JPY303]|uniref:FkbM family methyltransferase n=1 Tax=Paraburkholderia atlantica TaxID=2654982 RepID=UPI0015920E26|nr:FkbM family methyltransferase [Paraburkholderia atlantica]NUY35335.1 FkbM family methyltransferase [Paraburkholderia atlantica]